MVAGQVFAKEHEVYAIYLPTAAETGELDLRESAGTFQQRWFNPRTGAFVGTPTSVQGGQQLGLGTPPDDPSEDWVVLFTRQPVDK